jgi:hypothetical protein
MRIYVNDHSMELAPGMRVRHALIRAGFPLDLEPGLIVCDEWGNELGLDGALTDGLKIHVKRTQGQGKPG